MWYLPSTPSLELLGVATDHLLRDIDLFHQTNLSGFEDSAFVRSSLAIREDNSFVRDRFAGVNNGSG